ncbi:MAG: Rieske 2Fe-2S domain-containing protein [Cyanobacteria bacterium J06633_8]
MERRKFIFWLGIGLSLNSLHLVLTACNSQQEESETTSDKPLIDTSKREDGFQALAKVEEIDSKGVVLDKKSASKTVMIYRHPDNKNISAVNPTCTHKECILDWQSDTKNFACSCHGSTFSPDGEVIKGPAQKPLEVFDTKEEAGLVLVKVTSS